MNDLGAGGDLHQQLGAAMRGELVDDAVDGRVRVTAAMEMFDYAVWPLVSAALAAAQADTAERIAKAIEAHQDQDYPGARTYLTVRSAAAYARAVGVPGTETAP